MAEGFSCDRRGTWFAGLFYLPRLFVYHADTRDAPGVERFKSDGAPPVRDHDHRAGARPWLRCRHARGRSPHISPWAGCIRSSTLVGLLIIYHLYCYQFTRAFALDRNVRTAKWYRLFNELPSLLLIGIVILAVVKP